MYEKKRASERDGDSREEDARRWLSFLREERDDDVHALERKKNEEVKEDTSRGAERWGVYGNFSFSESPLCMSRLFP